MQGELLQGKNHTVVVLGIPSNEILCDWKKVCHLSHCVPVSVIGLVHSCCTGFSLQLNANSPGPGEFQEESDQRGAAPCWRFSDTTVSQREERHDTVHLFSAGSTTTLLYGWRQTVGNDHKEADMEPGGGVMSK